MFNPLQIVLLAALVGVWIWQKYNLQIFYYGSVAALGFLAGLIMGDVGTGMAVGGSMCLMSLGLFGAGGSSVPEYQVGCIAGTAFAIAMGKTGQDAAGRGHDRHHRRRSGRCSGNPAGCARENRGFRFHP